MSVIARTGLTFEFSSISESTPTTSCGGRGAGGHRVVEAAAVRVLPEAAHGETELGDGLAVGEDLPALADGDLPARQARDGPSAVVEDGVAALVDEIALRVEGEGAIAGVAHVVAVFDLEHGACARQPKVEGILGPFGGALGEVGDRDGQLGLRAAGEGGDGVAIATLIRETTAHHVAEGQPVGLEAPRVDVGEVVRDRVQPLLLGDHAVRGDVRASVHSEVYVGVEFRRWRARNLTIVLRIVVPKLRNALEPRSNP